jgi:hypothetical protein
MRTAGRLSLERLTTVILGIYLLGTAASHALRGEWIYTNYVLLEVPVPLAAATGILLLYVALFRWHWVTGGRSPS